MTKRRRRKPEQIVKLLQEGAAMLSAGQTLGKVLQQLEVQESTWLRWKKQYGGMNSAEARRLRELELENRRLKELLAESELDKRILKHGERFSLEMFSIAAGVNKRSWILVVLLPSLSTRRSRRKGMVKL